MALGADDAHRSQYAFVSQDEYRRPARFSTASPATCDALPNALFIGFTGTAIEQNDANTRAVFGEYVSV